MKELMLFKLLKISLCLAVIPCLAQSNSNDSIPDKALDPITITGVYGATGMSKAVIPVHIISIDRLTSTLGAQNVADVLKYQANIRLQQDNILGTGLTMQGISGENVKILIDGMPLTGRQNGNIDLSQLNLNNVERIEVVEGPLSVQYGTNALAGTINIITKKAPTKPLDFQVNTYYESVGTFNIGASLGWQKDNHRLMVSSGRNFFNGWSANSKTENIQGDSPLQGNSSDNSSSRFQDWKPKIQYFTDVNYGFTKGKIKIGYIGNYFSEYIINKGRPILPYKENAFDDTYKTRRNLNGLNLSHTFNNKNQAQLMVSYSQFQREKNTYFRNLVSLTQNLTDNPSDQDTTQFNLLTARGTFTKTSYEKLKFETGFDLNVETGEGLRIKNKKQTIGDYAAFFSAEWKITEGVTLRPGLRAAYNTSYRAPLIPSLHARWALNDFWTLRTSYGSGFRAPNLKELYFFFVDINHNIRGNKSLKAEKSHNINSVLTFKKAVKNNVYKLEASTFLNDVQNLITLGILRGGLNEYRYINIGHLRTIGGQAFGEIVLNKLTLAAGAACSQQLNILETGNRTAEAWEARGNIAYTLPSGWSFNAWLKHLGKQPGYFLNEDGSVTPTFIAAYSIADAGICRKIFKNKVSISTGIKNIFNVKNIQSQLVSSGHSSSEGSSPVAMGRFFFTKFEICL